MQADFLAGVCQWSVGRFASPENSLEWLVETMGSLSDKCTFSVFRNLLFFRNLKSNLKNFDGPLMRRLYIICKKQHTRTLFKKIRVFTWTSCKSSTSFQTQLCINQWWRTTFSLQAKTKLKLLWLQSPNTGTSRSSQLYLVCSSITSCTSSSSIQVS